MIKGIGLDIVEIDRIEKAIKRSEKFQQRILSERELNIFYQLSEKRKVEFLAGGLLRKRRILKQMVLELVKAVSFIKLKY